MAAISAGFQLFFLFTGRLLHAQAYPRHRGGQSLRILASTLHSDIYIYVVDCPRLWLVGFKIQAWPFYPRDLPVLHFQPDLFRFRI